MSDCNRTTALIVGLTDGGLSALLADKEIAVLRAQNAAAALEIIRRSPVDLIFADLLTSGMDCAEFFRAAMRCHTGAAPCCAITCVRDFPVHGTAAYPVLMRPYTLQALSDILPAMLLQRQCVDDEILARILRLMDRLGVPESSGRTYLAHAIALALRDPRLTGALSRALYPQIAALHGATSAQVERAIRRCIDKAWNRGPVEEQYRLFGNTIDAQRGKPAIAQMIARCADILRLEEFL